VPVDLATSPDAPAGPASTGRPAPGGAATAALAGGCALLVLRPALWRWGDPTVALTVLFVALLAGGAGWPLPRDRRGEPRAGAAGGRAQVAALLLGVAAFGAGRLLGGGHPPAPVSLRFVGLNTLAAVAEEAFFRRLAYGLLAPAGAGLAVVGTSVLFALAHVGVYGWWVAPLDLAAGLVLGWQRWATGSWAVPALTHVVANVLVVV